MLHNTAIFVTAALTLAVLGAATADQPYTSDCAASGELHYICDLKNPEDIIALPGSQWIVASGMAPKSGLHLINANTKTSERWIAPQAAGPKAPFDQCASQPAADELQAHGISVRDHGNGRATLYVVNHGGKEEVTDLSRGGERETIEVFDIDMTGRKPAITWAGCVPLPKWRVANSVVSGPDSAIYVTVMLHPENTLGGSMDRRSHRGSI